MLATTVGGDLPAPRGKPATGRRVSRISNDNQIQEALAALKADVFYVSGDIDRNVANALREAHDRRNVDNDCILILTTLGGDADAAYIMARFLQAGSPNGFRAFIPGRCKSAGTLLALSAKEIIMGRRGELGPLDIQVSEKDEPFRPASGLELFVSLASLTQNTFRTFETYMLQLIGRSGGTLSMKTAAKIATELTTGIMSPISQQIDPLQLGRRQRELGIVQSYAERLGISDEIVGRLANEYEDHGFVIDFAEARDLLKDRVRPPSADEARLEAALAGLRGLYDPSPKSPIVVRLNDLASDPQQQAGREDTHDQEPELRGRQEGERAEVDEQRQADGAEIHQASAPN